MLWPLILPAKLTAILLVILFASALAIAKQRKRRPGRTAILGIVALLLMFIPSCVAVKVVVDHFRFGMFQYADFDSIGDFRIERYMPQTAKRITVYKHESGNGYRARFEITGDDLRAWHQQVWDSYEQFSGIPPGEGEMRSPTDEVQFLHQFDEFAWQAPSDLVVYNGPIKANGAHYRIWHSESTQVAFLTSCYW